MGKGSAGHENPIKYLELHYGELNKEACRLKCVSDWNTKGRGSRFQCDYFVETQERKAIVDVIYYEGWMESLGKITAYFYEIEHRDIDCEVWIITNCKEYIEGWQTKLEKRFHGKKEDFIKYLRDWYSLQKTMCLQIIKPELRKKLKFYDFTGTDLWDYETKQLKQDT